MRLSTIVLTVVLILMVMNLYVVTKNRRELERATALSTDLWKLSEEWEEQDRQRPLYEFRRDKSYHIRPSRGDWILDNELETHVWDGERWVKMDFTEGAK